MAWSSPSRLVSARAVYPRPPRPTTPQDLETRTLPPTAVAPTRSLDSRRIHCHFARIARIARAPVIPHSSSGPRKVTGASAWPETFDVQLPIR